MPSSTARSSSVSQRASKPAAQSSAARLVWPLVMVLGVAAAVGGGIWTIVWMQERPIRQAQTLLDQGLDARAEALASGISADDALIKQAYHIVTEYLERFPNSTQGIALQARILVHMERPEEAIRLFEEAEAATSEELQDWARAYMMTGQFDLALPVMEQVLAQKPQDEDVIYELTMCRIHLGLFTEALQSAEQFTRLPGNEARGHLLQASVQAELGNAAAQVEQFERVLALDPEAKNLRTDPADLFYSYASGLLEVGRPEDALKAFTRSLELSKRADTYVGIGNAQVELGQSDLAERAWRQAVELAPALAPAREKLAQLAIENDKPEEALEMLLPLTNQDFVASSTSFLLQRTYSLLGDEAKATEWTEHTTEIRKRENLINVVNSVLRSAPTSMWGRAIRAHMALSFQRFDEAQELMATLPSEAQQQPFIAKLFEAVTERNPSKLPTFDELPVDLYQ